ncbi:hypothetical protein GCM10027184_06330 [Saccharothrix stipae]
MKFTMRLVLAVVAAAGVLVPVSAAHATECTPARVAAEDVNEYEGTTTDNHLVFQVTATADAGCDPVGSVRYYVEGTSATAGSDFTAVPEGTLTWTATSSATRSVTVTVHHDDRGEHDEQLELHLVGANGVVVTDPVAIGWLRDDDGMVLRPVQTEVDSGKICWVPDVCRVPIRFSVPLRAPVTLYYRTHDVTAIGGQDYVVVTRAKVTAKPGVTSVVVPVRLLPDQSPEPDEVFELEVLSTSAGRVVGGNGSVTVKSGQ